MWSLEDINRMNAEKPVITKAWHFLAADRKLRYDDNRVVVDGETLLVLDNSIPISLCEYGMHASVKVSDALRYAPGATLCLVEVEGAIIGDDKIVGVSRRSVWSVDGKTLLPYIVQYAAWCAERAKYHAAAARAATDATAARAAASTAARAAANAANVATADADAWAAADAATAAAWAAARAAIAADADATAAARADAAAAELELHEQWWLNTLVTLGAPL